MERNSINCIIFDEDETSIKDHRESRTALSTKTTNAPKSHHLEIIETEITYLTDKIRSLEEQADSLSHLKHENASMCRQSNTTIDIGQQQSIEILMAIEKKIQIVVRQTKKIVEKMTQNFDKKVKAKLSQKSDEAGFSKLKQQYQQNVKNIEQNYRIQLEEMQQHQRQIENKMVARVNAMEQKMVSRVKQMEKKEKEYVDWIHHLERQLQEQQEKSKKKLEVTHAKKEVSQSSSVLTGDNNQYESQNNNKIASQVGSSQFNSQVSNNPCNESKLQRRHKIFEPVGNKSSSVSPCNKAVSPLGNFNAPLTPNSLTTSSKLINPLHKPKPQQQQPQSLVQIDKPELVIERATEPLKNNFTGNSEREHSPWRQMDHSTEKRSTNRHQPVIKDENESQFYKDLPKANQGWERFQDFTQNDDSSSDSDEEVIFYCNEDKRSGKWGAQKEDKWGIGEQSSGVLSNQRQSSHYQPPIEQKVFSPFDLN